MPLAAQIPLAFATVGLATLATWLLRDELETTYLPLLVGAVVISAFYGGTWSALLAIILATICADYFLTEPRYRLHLREWSADLRLGIFALVCAFIVLVDYYRRVSISAAAESQRELREQDARLHVALEAGRMGAWEWNVADQTLRLSPEAQTLRGLESTDSFEGTIFELIQLVHPDDREALQLAISRALDFNSPELNFECRIAFADGDYRWIAAKGQVLRSSSGMPLSVSGIAWDNSDRKAAEDALLRSNEIKDEFLGMVSHELRTPITTMYSGARLLVSRYDSLTDTEKREVLQDIERESERLQLIVENLLALARQETVSNPELEPVSVQRTLEGAIRRLVKARPGRVVEFEPADEVAFVSGVPIYMELILRNVLDNADKYSPRDQPIEVAARGEDGHVNITVRDHGKGIPENELRQIFERFYRSPGTAANTSGAGIGLSVCRRLMESQGGSMETRNAEGGGLEVTMTLPSYSDA